MKQVRSLLLVMDFEDKEFTIRETRKKREPISRYADTINRNTLAAIKEGFMLGYIYYDILSSSGEVLYRGVFPDPIYSRVEFQPEKQSMMSTFVHHKKARYAVTVPYFDSAISIHLRRVNPEREIEDLGPANLAPSRR